MAAYRSFASLAYANRTNSTVTKPSGTVAGDKLIACSFAYKTSGTLATPALSGWTLISGFPVAGNTGTSEVYSAYAYWKDAGGSEPTNYTFTHATQECEWVMYAVSGANTGAPVVSASALVGTGTTTTAQGITVAAGSSIAFVASKYSPTYGSASAPTGTTPTFTERYDPAAGYLYLATGDFAAGGATGNKTHANGNSSIQYPWSGYLIGVEPAGGGTSDAVGSSTGAATASGVGAAGKAAAGTSAGAATASAVGRALVEAVGSVAGVATAVATGSSSSILTAAGSSAGVATVAGVASSTAAALGASVAFATGLATGSSTAASAGTSAGSATASAVGTVSTAGNGVGSSAGVATATGVGRTLIEVTGTANGASTASAVGTGITSAVGSTTSFPELISNGTFNTDTAGWVGATGGDVTWVSGTLRVTSTIAGTWGGARTSFASEIGRPYEMSGRFVNTSASAWIIKADNGTSYGPGRLDLATALPPTGMPFTRTRQFIATAATTYIWTLANNTIGAWTEIDDISVKGIPALGVGAATTRATGTSAATSTTAATANVLAASVGTSSGFSSAIAIAYQDPSLFDGSGGGWLIKKRREATR